MGGFDSFSTIFGAAQQVNGLAKSLSSNYSDYRNLTSSYNQAKRNYEQNESDIAAQAALDVRELQVQRDEETRSRKNTLKRAVASQQAAFGGQGIDTADGSGEAVMLGLYKESAEDKAYRDRMDKLKQDALNQDVTSKRRKNLLSLQTSYENARDHAISSYSNYF